MLSWYIGVLYEYMTASWQMPYHFLRRSRHIYRCRHLSRAKAGCRSRCCKISDLMDQYTANLQTYELSNCSVKTQSEDIDAWNIVYYITYLSMIWVPSIFIFETSDKCGKHQSAMFLCSRLGHWNGMSNYTIERVTVYDPANGWVGDLGGIIGFANETTTSVLVQNCWLVTNRFVDNWFSDTMVALLRTPVHDSDSVCVCVWVCLAS